jgi:hypothetical protein
MTKKKTIIAGIAIVVVIGAAYSYYQYNRAVQGLNDVKADYSLNATELINEFVNNETVANQKYQNKILAVKGTIKKVEDAGSGGIVVLGDTTDMSSVRCVLDTNTNAMGAALQRGALITIKGAITGFNKDETGLLGSDVQLNRCVIAN